MSSFIAQQIINQANISIEKGKNKYRAYFINTTIYLKWKEDVDAILKVEGYEECIVTE